MKQKELIWKIFSNAEIFGVVSHVHPDGYRSVTSAMLYRGLMGNYLE